MRKIRKRWKQILAFVMIAAFINGSINWPPINHIAFAAEEDVKTYQFYLQTSDNAIMEAEKCDVTCTVDGKANENVVVLKPGTSDEEDGGVSSSDVTPPDAQMLMSGTNNQTQDKPTVEVMIDWEKLKENQKVGEDKRIEVTFHYEGYDEVTEQITEDSELTKTVCLPKTIYRKQFTVELENGFPIALEELSVEIDSSYGNASSVTVDKQIDENAKKIEITLSRADEDTWNIPITLQYAGYRKHSMIINQDSDGANITLLPQVKVSCEVKEIEPGEQAVVTVTAQNSGTELNKDSIEWYLIENNITESLDEVSGDTYTFTAPTDVNEAKTVVIKAIYGGVEENCDYGTISVKVNPAAEIKDLIEQEGIYYAGTSYDLQPQGFAKYSIESLPDTSTQASKQNLERFKLPLSNEKPEAQSLGETPKSVRFYRESGAISIPYKMAQDIVAPEFVREDIEITPLDTPASERTITVQKPNDAGVGGVTMEYTFGEAIVLLKEAASNASPTLEENEDSTSYSLVLQETSKERKYTFIAKDALGNSISYDVDVPAIDATRPEILSVRCNGKELTNDNKGYTNQDVLLEIEAVDDTLVYSSGIKQIDIYKEDANGTRSFMGSVSNQNADSAQMMGEYTINYSELIETFANIPAENKMILCVKDNAGNLSNEMCISIIAERQPPTQNYTLLVGGQEADLEKVLNQEEAEKGVVLRVTNTDNIELDDMTYRVNWGEEHKIQLSGKEDNRDISINIPSTSGEITITTNAYDKAGNQVLDNQEFDNNPIIKFDIVDPELTLKVEDREVEATNNTLYTKASLTVDIVARDDVSASENIQLQVARNKPDGSASPVIIEGSSFTFKPLSEGVSEEATYTITASDQAGNTYIRTLTIIYDNTLPKLTAAWVKDGETVEKEWLNAEDAKNASSIGIAIKVTDEITGEAEGEATEESVCAGIDYVKVSNESMDDKNIALIKQPDGTYIGYFTISKTQNLDTVYQVEAYDRAGNCSISEVNVRLDITLPVVTCEEPKGWKTGKVALYPQIQEAISGEQTLQYEIYAKDSDKPKVTNLIDLTTNGERKIVLEEDGYWTVKMYAIDQAGNRGSSISSEVKIDTKAPTAQRVYAEYEDVNVVTLKDKVVNLFGRTKTEVTLYVQDDSSLVTRTIDYSDIKSVTVKYGNKEITVKPQEEIVAVLNDNTVAMMDSSATQTANVKSVFRVVKFTINDSFSSESSVGEQIASKLEVLKITDHAGKEYSGSKYPVLLDGTNINLVIIDGIAPILQQVDYQEGSYREVDNVYYYRNEVTLGMDIKEHFLHDAKLPQVKLTTDGKQAIISGMSWAAKSGQKDVYAETLQLSEKENQEIEYQFQIIYKDGANNPLWAKTSAYQITNGRFTSPKIVVDTKAPIMESMKLTSVDGSSIPLIDGQYFVDAQNGNAIKAVIVMEDDYFNQDNLNIKALKDGVELAASTIRNLEFQKKEGTDFTEVSFTFDGDGSGTASYIFEISYEDNAGNPMVLGDGGFKDAAQGTMKNGVYITKIPIVISRHMPTLSNVNVTANSTSASMEFVNGKYYVPTIEGDDVAFSFVLEEAYLNKSLVKVCYNKGAGWKTFTEEEIQWTEIGRVNGIAQHKAVIMLDGVDNCETEYRFAIGYTNYNGQKMILAQDDTSSGAAAGEIKTGTDTYYTEKPIVIDNKNPELTNLTIVDAAGQPITGYEEASLYFHNNQNNGAEGVRVEFTLNDNSTYFDSDKVQVEVLSSAGSYIPDQVEFTSHGGRTQKGSFLIEGVEGKALDYRVRITFIDQSGRQMVLSQEAAFDKTGITTGTMKQGCYTTSHKVIIDRKAPILEEVEISNPYQYANDKVTQNGIQNQLTKLYYNSDANISFKIAEGYWYAEDVIVTLYKKGAHDSFAEAQVTQPKVTYQGGEASFSIQALADHSADGEYYFTISYKDRSANEMIKGESENESFYPDALKNGVYTSPILVIDTIAPQVGVTYEGEIVESLGEIDFYDNPYTAVITVQETNFRTKELTEWVNSGGNAQYGITLREWRYNEEGVREYKALEETTGIQNIQSFAPDVHSDDIYTLMIPIQQEDNYELGVTYVDMAGNEAKEVLVKQTVYDSTAPEVTVSYQVNDSGFLDFIRYGDWGYLFAQKKITMTAQVTDSVAGVRNFEHTVYENQGGNAVVIHNADDYTNEQTYHKTFSVTLPLEETEQDFDGILETKVYDWAENYEQLKRNHLVESAATHAENAGASITINTPPARVVDGIKYYNGSSENVSFTVNANENYSGLRYVKVEPVVGRFEMSTNAMPSVAANQSMDGTYSWNVRNDAKGIEGTGDMGTGQPAIMLEEAGIAAEMTGELVEETEANMVKQFQHTGSFPVNENNDLNGIQLKMQTISNTGYQSNAVSEPITIDMTAPTVLVEFNDIPVSNENYYKDVRVATITFTERNFQVEDIQWDITNTEGVMPQISDFTNNHSGQGSDNQTQHVGTVTFAEDGDYTFAFSFMDKAGNTVEYETEPFTIDLSKPVIEVSFDNNDSVDGNYYSEARNATVTITEHNFEASGVEITVAATNNGDLASTPSVSSFHGNGDEHYATIAFDYDAEFSLAVAYTDMAGNEAEVVEQQNFIVDLSDPEIVIEDIEPFSANRDKVAPIIEFRDTNFDGSNISVTLTGYGNGTVDYAASETAISNGRRITFADFTHEQGVDDMYTLKASITDKAGRTTEKEVVFSVNRFGSTYQFDEATKEMLDKYYTNAEQQLVITETNVDTLEFKELYLMRDGEKVELEEGSDYSVEESGNEVSWKQYTYTLDKDNFAKEGVYEVVIYSEDRAQNVSDNRTKDSGITFIVDKTAPTIAISGVEADEQYVVDERLVTVDVKDNMELGNMQIYVNDNTQPMASYSTEEILEAGGVVSVMLGSSNNRQTLLVGAVDKAGNQSHVSVEDFLITSNMLVQFYRNTPLLMGTIILIALIVAGILYFFIFLKKSDDDEEEENKQHNSQM